MKTATTALVTVVRLDGVPLVVLGLLFWSGNALTLIPLHMLLGIALVLALWALAVLAAVSRVQPGLVALSALWGFVVPVLGLTQDQLLPGPAHWTIRLPHLLVGLTAIALANVLGARLRRHLAAPSGSGGVAEHASLGEIARAAEEAGFDRIGVADHVWRSHYMGTVEGPELECYTTLGFLAASTRRAKLAAMVTAASYRAPGLLAKTVTTLDVLSGGRAWLGIGAGDYEAEARGLGLSFPPLKERFEILEETLQICLRMWDGEHGDDRPYQGKHVRLERTLNVPQSLTRPHPPILLGGSGTKTLRLVARYADACNIPPGPDIPEKLALLHRFCDEEQRDYDAIEKTSPFAFDVVGEDGNEDSTKVGTLLDQLRWLASMGIQTVTGFVPGVDRITPLEILGCEVIPAVADL